MKKGKSRNKRKKTRSRLLWIAIAVIGIAAVISAVCVAGMLATKENAWRTPEELLVEYMDHIPKQEYEEMYAMLHIEASGNISQEDFVTRNSAIYEGIEVQNMAVQIIAYDEEHSFTGQTPEPDHNDNAATNEPCAASYCISLSDSMGNRALTTKEA